MKGHLYTHKVINTESFMDLTRGWPSKYVVFGIYASLKHSTYHSLRTINQTDTNLNSNPSPIILGYMKSQYLPFYFFQWIPTSISRNSVSSDYAINSWAKELQHCPEEQNNQFKIIAHYLGNIFMGVRRALWANFRVETSPWIIL